MKNFEIIPVIDILNSKAVHAIKGERSKYKILQSYLFNSSLPKEIIEIISKKFNFNTFYIADLDSIVNNNPNFKIIKEIISLQRIKLIIDPGIKNEEDIEVFSKLNIHNLIFGLETIQNFRVISSGIEIIGLNKLIVSIDMYGDKIFSNNLHFQNKKILPFINSINNLGVEKIILLDLKRVGTKIGGIPKLYNTIKRRFDGKIFVGGGIRDIDDIKQLIEKDFAGVLVGTALYDGTITIEDFKSI